MFLRFIRDNFSILFFIFSASISAGIVFISVEVNLPIMLSEKGWPTSKIAIIFLASLPYSFRFIFSPFIKNIIDKFNGKSINIIKILAFFSQSIIIFLLSLIGSLGQDSSLILTSLIVCFLITSVSVLDILNDYIRLSVFNKKEIGFAISFCNIGFRLGLFLSGAGGIYLAEAVGWSMSFFILGLFVILNSIAAIFLPKIETNNEKVTKNFLIKNYLKSLLGILKSHNIIIILILIFIFKFSDSCIHALRPLFLQTIGISKIIFANISQVLGAVSSILGGIAAGSAIYRIGTKRCIRLSFILQIIGSCCYVFLVQYNSNIISTATAVNLATLLFGFSAVVFRTYVSEVSDRDINTYMFLMSIGSLTRSLCAYIGGIMTDYFSWEVLFTICIISNIPGIYIYKKMYKIPKI